MQHLVDLGAILLVAVCFYVASLRRTARAGIELGANEPDDGDDAL